MKRRRILRLLSSPIDLSMVDNAGNPRNSMTTANCYLVHAAGDYKIPLVYGNAIKNGADNRIAYYPGENSTITNGINQFVNHEGAPISGPWITKSKSGTGVNKGMGLTASLAQLLWQDRTGLITDVSVSGDYLNFTVGTFGAGNALIAVYGKSGNIMWSWHIWATEDDLSGTTVINTGNHIYNVAPVNVGWVPTDGGGKQGYCPYYQWGRKDPFIPGKSNSTSDSSDKTVYSISGETITGYNFISSATSIPTAIKNPKNIYVSSTDCLYSGGCYYNLWNAQNISTGEVSTATKKTVYDPCPPGFCVPTSNLHYYLNRNNSESVWDDVNKGKMFTFGTQNYFFPASGWRNIYGSGTMLAVGASNRIWSSIPYDNTSAINLFLGQYIANCINNGTGNPYSIRPVAEE